MASSSTSGVHVVVGVDSDDVFRDKSLQDIAQVLKTRVSINNPSHSPGLQMSEAEELIKQVGPNRLTEKRPPSVVMRFLKQLLDPFLILLAIAALLSFGSYWFAGEHKADFWLGLALVVLILGTASISLFQEGRAATAMNKFTEMMPRKAVVRRSGTDSEMDSSLLVPGDIIKLKAGDRVPADAIILKSEDLRLDMSSITGEALPVRVRATTDLTDPQITCFALSSNMVMKGTGVGAVIRTGDRCSIGQIAKLTSTAPVAASPLRRNLNHFVTRISLTAIGMAAVMFSISLARFGTSYFPQRFVSGFIIVLVANVPQGLPAGLSGALAVAAIRLSNKNVLIKRLEILDTLGTITVIATDKTGTLTQNHMAVASLYYNGSLNSPDYLYHPRHIREVRAAILHHDVRRLLTHRDALHVTIIVAALCNEANETDQVEQEHDTSTASSLSQPIRRQSTFDYDRRIEHVPGTSSLDSTSSTITALRPFQTEVGGLELQRRSSMPIIPGVSGSFPGTVAVTPLTGRSLKTTRAPRGRDRIRGNASDVALFAFAEQYVDVPELRGEFRLLFTVPFSSERKWMAMVWRSSRADLSTESKVHLVMCKGAFEKVSEMCSKITHKGREEPLTQARRRKLNDTCKLFASRGERVMAIALLIKEYRERDQEEYFYDEDEDGSSNSNIPLSSMTMVSLVSIHDPPKAGVPDAVTKCHSAGIRVMMITGDHPTTAEAIARQVNIIRNYQTQDDIDSIMDYESESDAAPEAAGATVVLGEDLEQFQRQDWDDVLSKQEIVFARTSAANKLKIVEELQRRGESVAMTGDGVNDSPAIRKADVGIAMGLRGHDVARDAADVVLVDDDFCSIVNGIEEGRLVYDNLRKMIAYILAHLVPEIAAIAITLVFGLPPGMNPLMILCIDLGTEVCPSLSFAYEKPEDEIMRRPPRDHKRERLVNIQLFLYSYIWVGIPIAIISVFAYLMVFISFGVPTWALVKGIYFTNDSPPLTVNGHIFDSGEQLFILYSAQSAFLSTIVLSQVWHIWTVKTRINSIREHGLFGNRLMNAGVILELGIVIILLYTPALQNGLDTRHGEDLAIWLPSLLSLAYITIFNIVRKKIIRDNHYQGRFAKIFAW